MVNKRIERKSGARGKQDHVIKVGRPMSYASGGSKEPQGARDMLSCRKSCMRSEI